MRHPVTRTKHGVLTGAVTGVPVFLASVLVFGALGACSSAEQLAGQGGTCSVVTDCQDGFVCVPKDPKQPNGARVCSSSTMNIIPASTATATSTVDSGAPPGQPVADAAGQDAPSIPMSTADGSTPAPTEAGTPVVEAGPAPMDAQPPAQEAQAPPVDSGGGTDAHAD